VVLQHLHSGDRLLTLCSGQSLTRARLRIFFCTCQRACLFAVEARSEQQGFQPHEPFPELGRQFWDCFHHNGDGTPASVPSNKSRIGHRRHVSATGQQDHRADELSRYEGLLGSGRRLRLRKDICTSSFSVK
jgi:hypothetical protein